jgi:membrane protease YdiL (CAAX protease family)
MLLLGLELAYWAGGPQLRSWLAGRWFAWMLLLLALAVAYLVLAKKPPSALGYRRDRAFTYYMRGAAAGALWRLFSMLTNYYGWWDLLPGPDLGLPWAGLLSALVVVPLMEETIFRGYLQAGLEARFGPALSIAFQALLFALHPAHATQGWRAFPSVFTFGLLAGVLYWRTRSLWIVLGAHGIANVLPYVIRGTAGWVYGS